MVLSIDDQGGDSFNGARPCGVDTDQFNRGY